jgi:hypothetical protein
VQQPKTETESEVTEVKVIDHTDFAETVPIFKITPNISTKELQAAEERQHQKIYEEQQAVYRGEVPDWKHEMNRRWVWKQQEKQKPDLSHLVFRRSIGHYGGDIIVVPEEHFQEFKSHFPKREFPRNVTKEDIREKYTVDGELRFRKRFPNSNYAYWIDFAHGTQAEKRLEFMKIAFTD